MIKKEISRLAEKLGIKVYGFSDNAFVALFPYYKKEEEGNISLYARSFDYHKVIKSKLEIIKEKFVELGAKSPVVHCDNGELNDRKAAYNAGLGFYGRNNILINDEYGSYFFIGQVVHDLKIEADTPLNKTCMNCGKCLEACVTGVLKAGFKEEKCLSAITQKKDELSEEEKGYILKGGLCWGCDSCQSVCPHNNGLEDTLIDEFAKERIASLDLADIENLSEREFKKRYSDYAFSWRGAKVLRRNLEILRDKYEEK